MCADRKEYAMKLLTSDFVRIFLQHTSAIYAFDKTYMKNTLYNIDISKKKKKTPCSYSGVFVRLSNRLKLHF